MSEGTRGRIVGILRRSPATVADLAEAVGLTGNAVRRHLAVLERDGWVERVGERRGRGKPARVYRASRAAERRLSRAYAPVLTSVLAALGDRLADAEVEAVLEDAGRRIAPSGTEGARTAEVVGLLEELGGVVEVEEDEGGGALIRGHGCPLGALDGQQAKACRIVGALLGAVAGRPVREACDRAGDRARCVFEVSGVDG